MTEDSLFDRDPLPERRELARTGVVSRPVLFETEGFSGFCVLSDLSPRGLAAITDTRFIKGEPVCVQLMPDHAVNGRIVWSDEGRLGMEFDRRIDMPAFGTGSGIYAPSRFNRLPRVQLDCEAVAVMDQEELKIVARDISQSGIRLMFPEASPGDRVEIRLPDSLPQTAAVRWAQRFDAGLKFERALSFEELGRLAIACRFSNSRERAESLRRTDYWQA